MVWDLQIMKRLNEEAVNKSLEDKMLNLAEEIDRQNAETKDQLLSKQEEQIVSAAVQSIMATVFERVATILKVVDLEVAKHINDEHYDRAVKLSEGFRLQMIEETQEKKNDE